MQMRLLAALVGMFLGAGLAVAQPTRPAEPTLEVRLRSVNDLLDKAEFVGGLFGQEEVGKAVKDLVKSMTREKTGLEGIDPKKPFGLYAYAIADVVNSPVAAMIPIADKDRFLKLLKDRLNIVPKDAEGGTFTIPFPIPNPILTDLYIRFADDYLYVARAIGDLDPKKLVKPAAFFAKDDGAIASVILHLDGIPKELKTFVIGQFELAVAERRKLNGAQEDALGKAFFDWVGDGLTSGLKTFLEDSKELGLRAFLDAKSEEISLELNLTARSGSTLAKNFAALQSKPSIPAAIVSGKNRALRATSKVGLTPELKERFAKVIATFGEQFGKDGDPNPMAVYKQIFDVLAPTFKAGALEAAIGLAGPDSKGKHTLIAAMAVEEGKQIEKLLKDLAEHLGPVAQFDFDVEKIGEFSLHKIALADAPPEMERIFGTKIIWLAVSDSYVALSVEADGAAIRAGLKAKAMVAPILSIEVGVARLLPIVAKDLKPEDVEAILKEAFGAGGIAGKDKFALNVFADGDRLKFEAKVQGKVIRTLFEMNKRKAQ